MTSSSATPQDYLPPPRSVKGCYPFRLGTTSFIYPDHYVPNVQMLGPYFDEVELLMFESRWPDSLPTGETIDALARISAETDLGYNIHLPTDVSLAARRCRRTGPGGRRPRAVYPGNSPALAVSVRASFAL